MQTASEMIKNIEIQCKCKSKIMKKKIPTQEKKLLAR